VRQRVTTGFVNPSDPSKGYVATAHQEDDLPSYNDSQNKKKD